MNNMSQEMLSSSKCITQKYKYAFYHMTHCKHCNKTQATIQKTRERRQSVGILKFVKFCILIFKIPSTQNVIFLSLVHMVVEFLDVKLELHLLPLSINNHFNIIADKCF